MVKAHDFRRTALGLVSLLLPALLSRLANGASLELHPGTGNRVHGYAMVLGPEATWGAGDYVLEVNSPVPVSILRYHDSKYLWGEAPLQPGEVHIVVKSNCTGSSGDSLTADITTENGDDGITSSISIDVNQMTPMKEPPFLNATSFHATWSYVSAFCNFEGETSPPTVAHTNPPSGADDLDSTLSPVFSPTDTISDNTEPLGMTPFPTTSPKDSSSGACHLHSPSNFLLTSAGLVTGLALLLPHGVAGGRWQRSALSASGAFIAAAMAYSGDIGTGILISGDETNPRALQDQESLQSCQVSAEILLDACFQPLRVVAPAVRFLDVVVVNETDSRNKGDSCKTDYEAILTFPGETLFPVPMNVSGAPDTDGRMTFNIPTLKDVIGGECERAVEGRPFVDARGHQLHAEECTQNVPIWSHGSESARLSPPLLPDAHKNDGDGNNLGVEWTRRALGEHASIASFAAFTVALLSNGAPPDLVRDSLLAALDEVRHAQMSFEAASLLTGHIVEPGLLPPSSHDFGPDLTALAIGAAREGCVDETLSALAAAAEVDRYAAATKDGDKISASLRDRIKIIALEEGRHSALAWRTVLWACREDTNACATVQKEVFAPERLANAARRRYLNGGSIEKEWKVIYETLVPLLTIEEDGPEATLDVKCSKLHLASETETKSMTEHLVDNILKAVYCSIFSKGDATPIA